MISKPLIIIKNFLKREWNKGRLGFIITILFAVAYGYAEYELLSRAPSSGEKWFLGHFSTYHIFMFFVFICASFAAGFSGWRNIPLMILIEDYFYHVAKHVQVKPDDWVSWGIGGFEIFGLFVPWTYIILLVIPIAFYWRTIWYWILKHWRDL